MPRRNYLSKIQVDKASHMLLDYYGHNATSILNTIRGQMLSETHICKSIPRQEICNQITTNTSLCSDMVARYSDLNDTFPKTDSKESLLAFGGACMRLIYISAKSNGDMDMRLIQNLKLTREQRTLYILGIFCPNVPPCKLYTLFQWLPRYITWLCWMKQFKKAVQ